jgi:glycosyltransferase involved in cell wall biosynthesis
MTRLASIVIPTLHEGGAVESLRRLTGHLEGLTGRRFEIIVVDDSREESYRDELRRFAAELRGNCTVHVLRGERRGKGDANRMGALASNGDIVFTMDADLTVPLAHIEEFLAVLDAGEADVVIAERQMARNLDRPLRFVVSRSLFVLQRVFIFPHERFLDTQCGFKAYRGDFLRDVARRQVVKGGMCDIEYVFAARAQGRAVARVRVVPTPERRESRIRVWRAMMTDPLDLVRIRAHGLCGHYGRADRPLA